MERIFSAPLKTFSLLLSLDVGGTRIHLDSLTVNETCHVCLVQMTCLESPYVSTEEWGTEESLGAQQNT